LNDSNINGQLEQSQSLITALQSNLATEKQKLQSLHEEFYEMKRELGLSKVDVRVLNRKNRDLETQLADKKCNWEQLNSRIETLEKENELLTKQKLDHETEMKSMTLKLDTALLESEHSKKILDEANAQIAQLNSELKTACQGMDKSLLIWNVF